MRFQGIIDAYKRAQSSEVLKRLPAADPATLMPQAQP
jgi:hypothetical protein